MSALKPPVGPNDHIQGDPAAPIVLVEYGDYECPHCGRAYPIVQAVQKHFGKRLAFVFRNFPLKQIHPLAEPAAETAEFASAHGKFWEMHDAIFENQANLGLPMLLDLARILKLPVPKLESALESNEYAPRVHEDFMGGVKSGVNGTPTFFINGHRHDGPFDLEVLVEAVDSSLT